ncbi:MAG: quinoprotein dehydrogenase-associated putative ABC transporter substrate-binding protein [Methylococcales bacterium]|jgi:quinoprotein dehydrogenase-associated probable ABC transporter substrate-binding protein|nr:quinoprotein dehydrogenase-associated putative ABC transporter substrate-binding protein [Methylococcales bacterium]MBT3507793.1 quinoprotein dehydrogenase-associated putative ABC transporter substrate-binding protein [Methylococcales bacterium]MBT3816074.1 quinoprotein dehydrogenase-associated putative ABC transporter substrate-binding protein [Methylococcales bacterium]MBT4032106.1 quinoprotein dehydrogenase-associated putative ABC transporter substrate-binding protein [Methylococcales bact
MTQSLFAITSLCCTLLFSSAVLANDAFKVCADPLHPPYSLKDGSGFENDIAAVFAKQLNLPLEFTWFPQRIGFIRNTLRAPLADNKGYKCNVVMGVPTGYDLALTTKPYYHSSYVLVIAKGRGWDDITSPSELADAAEKRLDNLKIAMFDRGPGTTWLHRNGLIDQGIPYQTMTGDNENNTAMMINKDLRAGKIDMVILWGPMAGYVLGNGGTNNYNVIPLKSNTGMKFDFSISMAVRYGDKIRKERLEKLIDENAQTIQDIIQSYHIPLLPIPKYIPRDDD